jgi:hypothetical protein
MKWNPCKTEEEVLQITGGRRQMSPLEVLDCDAKSEDKLWVLLRNPIFTDRELRLMACDFADEVLPIYENAYPDDRRARDCIEMSKKFANGECSAEEVDAARAAAFAAWAAASDAASDAARAAAWAAAWAAARAASDAASDAARAAWAAVRAAARDAAWAASDAAWDAARAAAGKQQLAIVRKYLEAQQ